MKRLTSRKQLGALVGTVVLVGAGGWFAGTQVRSPADAAAAHSAPKAGPVTVAVGRQSLTATVVATGSVAFASPQPLSLAGPVGSDASGDTADKGGDQRVTKAPVAGTKVKEGDVLMTVNGRPVFALRGTVPMYRSLGPGSSGDDVKELQSAMARLGFDPGSTGGTYGHGTATAVTNWYASKGYQAQQPTSDEQQQLGQLQQAVSSAQEGLLTAQAGAAAETQSTPKTGTGTESVPKTGTDTETQSVPKTGSTTTGTPSAPKTGTTTSTKDGTHTGTSTSGTESSTDKKVQDLQLKSAQQALDMANSALAAFQSTYGTKLPAGEAVFFPKLPVRLDKVSVKTGDAATGQIGTVTSSDMTVQAVVPGSDAALLKKGMTAEVATSDSQKTVATGVVQTIGASAPSSSSGSSSSPGSSGSSGSGSDSGSGDAAAGGSGASTTDTASGSDSSAPVQVLISLPDPGPLSGDADTAVKVTVKVGSSDGKVLTVPLAAVRTSADGKARVQVQRDGKMKDVHVTVGLSAGGLVEVKPSGGTLEQGDRVVVGE